MMSALHKFLLFHVLICIGGKALGSKIIHGRKTTEKSMLYMASLQDSKRHHICGGFLISENCVLTAAHCDNVKSVVLGTFNLKNVSDRTMRFNVMKFKHRHYVNVSNGNDIMLLKLLKKAPLNKIKPIQIPKQEMKLKENQMCRVAGWGKTATHGKSVDQLQEVDVPIINLKKCQEKWRNILPATVICAGGYGTDKGFCQGDSGGPLVCNGKAVGIVSFNHGADCDYPNVPNVYTDISKFLPWIKESLKKNNC